MRGAAQLAMGHGAAQLLGLARNFAVARLLGPEDFGVAATFAATIAVVEATTDIGADRYLVQSARGEDPALQRTLHGVMAARGLLSALVVFLLADPVAALFGAPETAAGFRWLALAPLMRGFVHTDAKRLQRGLSFRREAAIMAAAQAAALLVAVALAFALRSWWAMLWGVLAHAATQVATSHALAERPYRLGLARDELRGALAFGWPLTLNGVVLALAAQGDRIVVGAALGMAELGVYAAATILLTAVYGALGRIYASLTLPWLSRSVGQPDGFLRKAGLCQIASGGLATATAGVMALAGPTAVSLIFGPPFRPDFVVWTVLSAAFSLRIMRASSANIAMSLADTTNMLIGNLLRIAVLAAALAALRGELSLLGVATAVFAAEAAALILSFLRISGRHLVPWRTPAATFATALIVQAGLYALITSHSAP